MNQLALKILANATSYGIFIELNVECSATIWMGRRRQSGWSFWRSRRG